MKRPVLLFFGGLVLAAMLAPAAAPPASAQVPDQFTNLKVLPKDISKRDLMGVMKEFTAALGVRCDHCHVPGPKPGTLEGFDFASDEPKDKLVAREMMRMVGAINADFIAKAGMESPTEVRCVTCHRGVHDPETLDRKLLGMVEKDGRAAAEASYRELRADYYGTGSYDFTSGTLLSVADALARKNDMENAVAIAEFNLEFHGDDAGSHASLAQFYAAAGKKDEAVKSLEKALELDPGNGRYQQMIEKVRSGS